MRRGRREYLCEISHTKVCGDSFMVGRRDRGHVGHRGVRHGLLRGFNLPRVFKMPLPFSIWNKIVRQTVTNYIYLYLSQLSARCWFEPTRLSTRRRCTRHQCRLAASSLSLRSHAALIAAPASPPRPWPLTRPPSHACLLLLQRARAFRRTRSPQTSACGSSTSNPLSHHHRVRPHHRRRRARVTRPSSRS